MPNIVSLGARSVRTEANNLDLSQVKAYLRRYARTIDAMIGAGTLSLNPSHRSPDGGVQICVHALAQDFNVSPSTMTSMLIEGSLKGEIDLRWVHIQPRAEELQSGVKNRCWLFAGLSKNDREMPANAEFAGLTSVSQMMASPARLSL